MPTSTDDSDNAPRRRPSRLEAEIEEILARTEAQSPPRGPVPFRRPPRPRTPVHVSRPWRTDAGRTLERWLTTAPLLTALVLAIIAVLVREVSPLLTHLIVVGSVIALFWPLLRRIRGPEATGSRTWRGRTIDIDRPGPSVLDDIRRWFRQRR